MSKKGSWGLYPWFEEHGEHLIHPCDLDSLKELSPYGKVFFCVEDDSNYLTLKYGDKTFRVDPVLFKQVNEPAFLIGSIVKLADSRAEGVVVEIEWHYKSDAPFYHVSVNGKKKTKRYFEDNFSRES